jgi:hypothetical protein
MINHENAPKQIAGCIGNLDMEEILNQPEIKKSIAKGGVIGRLILNGEVIENGIGVWIYENK